MYQMPDKTASDNPFPEWMKRHKLTMRGAAEALGCSKSSVLAWQTKAPPKYVMMACQCYSQGLPPWGSLSDLSPPIQ